MGSKCTLLFCLFCFVPLKKTEGLEEFSFLEGTKHSQMGLAGKMGEQDDPKLSSVLQKKLDDTPISVNNPDNNMKTCGTNSTTKQQRRHYSEEDRKGKDEIWE